MNNFGINIAGYTGVCQVRPGFNWSRTKGKGTVADRSFHIESGPGCRPESGTRRAVQGRWLDDRGPGSLQSDDFEYLIDPKGKRVSKLPEEPTDVEPVMLAGETNVPGLPPIDEIKKVRRKRG